MEITMNPRVRASEILVRVETRGYDPDLGPHLALSCEYRDVSFQVNLEKKNLKC